MSEWKLRALRRSLDMPMGEGGPVLGAVLNTTSANVSGGGPIAELSATGTECDGGHASALETLWA